MTRRYPAVPRLLLAAGILGFGLPPDTRAQTTSADTTRAEATGADTTRAEATRADTIRPIPLPAIEVRILRTPMRRDDVPLSVSALGRSELTGGKAGASLEEALQGIPGLQVQNRYNFSTGEKIVLRGIGARTQFGVRGIRIVVDGIPATLPDGQSTLDHLDLFSLGSVEVLRGPGANLYGNGAGGVIRFATRPPSDTPSPPEVSLVGGSHGLLRGSALASGRVAGTGYLISVGRMAFDGFRQDPTREGRSYGGVRRWNGNGQVTRSVAGGALTATLSYLSQDSENPGSLSRALQAENPTQAYRFNVAQKTGEEVTQSALGLSWAGGFRDLVVEVGAHGILRDLWNPIPPAIIDLERRTGGVRAEIRGAWQATAAPGGDVEVGWTLGVEGEGQWDRRRNLENDGGSPGDLTLDQDETVTSGSAFTQARIGIGERVTLLGGLRYDRLRFRADDHLVSPSDPDDSGSRVLEALSPSLGIRLTLTDGLTLRGSASSFFQTPTTSELANQPTGAGGFNPGLEPQRGTSFEAGVLVRADASIRFEGTLFHTRIRDELIPFELPESPGRVFFRNAGESVHEGVEVATYGLLPGGVTLRGAYTYTRSRYESYSLESEELAGNRIPGVAPHRLDGVLRWRGGVGGGGLSGLFEIRGLYQGAVPVNDRNTDAAGSYGLVELRGEIEGMLLAASRWSLFGGVTNLLDRGYTASVSVNAFGGRFFEPGPGRGFYMGVRTAPFHPGR